jgi:hypothetical protein
MHAAKPRRALFIVSAFITCIAVGVLLIVHPALNSLPLRVAVFGLGISLGPCLAAYATAPTAGKQRLRRLVLLTGGMTILAFFPHRLCQSRARGLLPTPIRGRRRSRNWPYPHHSGHRSSLLRPRPLWLGVLASHGARIPPAAPQARKTPRKHLEHSAVSLSRYLRCGRRRGFLHLWTPRWRLAGISLPGWNGVSAPGIRNLLHGRYRLRHRVPRSASILQIPLRQPADPETHKPPVAAQDLVDPIPLQPLRSVHRGLSHGHRRAIVRYLRSTHWNWGVHSLPEMHAGVPTGALSASMRLR